MSFKDRLRPWTASSAAILALSLSSTALASADRAVKACKSAIADERGSELSARLKKIQSRGGSYEAWFNLSHGATQLKAYCVSKRSTVEIITSEGSWTGRNPQRPE